MQQPPMTKMNDEWYIYIIRCKMGTLYTGITKNIERRIKEHEAGKSKASKYLRGRSPLTLAFSHIIEGKSNALSAEFAIKNVSLQKKEQLIRGELDLESILTTND